MLEQAHLVERRAHAPRRVFRRVARDLQRQRDVVEHVAIEQQLVILKNQSEPAPQKRHRALVLMFGVTEGS